MTIDVIILSNTSNLEKYGMTCRSINSLHQSCKASDYKFNVILVESNEKIYDEGFIYDCNTTVIFPKEEFNYNRFLNIGLKHCSDSDWILISNNDVIFTENWLKEILSVNNSNPDILSFSPISPNWHCHKNLPDSQFIVGYRSSYEVCGWCLLIKPSVVSTCNLFDERFKFWYQDDDYALELKSKNIKHALVTTSRVYHMESSSHDLLGSEKENLTNGQSRVFLDKWQT